MVSANQLSANFAFLLRQHHRCRTDRSTSAQNWAKCWYLAYCIHIFNYNHDLIFSGFASPTPLDRFKRLMGWLRSNFQLPVHDKGFPLTDFFEIEYIYIYGKITSDCTLPRSCIISSSSPGCSILQLDSANLSVVLTNHAGEIYSFEDGADKMTLCISP